VSLLAGIVSVLGDSVDDSLAPHPIRVKGKAMSNNITIATKSRLEDDINIPFH
jgi:hypothetical protein